MGISQRLSFLCLGLLVLAGGCVNLKKPSNKIDFYTLEYDGPQLTGMDGAQPLAAVIKVQRFAVAPTYNTNQIIYRDQDFKREGYAYNKWRANPGDLVTYHLARDITQSGLFRAVLPYDSSFAASHSLEGSVDEFLEWDTEEVWKAVLALTVTLLSEDEPDITKRIVFQKTYRIEEPCSEKTPPALAQAMSRAMAGVSGQIIGDLCRHLR